MASRSKGQMISVLTVVVLLFVSGGALFTGLIGSQEIQETVTYSTDDINALAEAKVNAEMYRFNIRKELNYTFNNVAYELGEEAGGVEWEDNIPDMEDVNTTFKDQLLNREDINIITQNRAGECDPPEIDDSMLDLASKHELRLEFSDPWIECDGLETRAMVPVDDSFAVDNTDNNYLSLANDSIELANESWEIINNTQWSRNGTVEDPMSYVDVPDESFNNACYHLSGSDESQADDDAYQSAEEQYDDTEIAEEAYDNLDSEGELYEFVNDLETRTVIEGEINPSQGYPETQTCTYRKCIETETSCPPPGEDGECTTSCVDRAPEEEKEYDRYRYRFDADKAFLHFEIEDADNSVITYDSDETDLVFDFTYINDEQVDGM